LDARCENHVLIFSNISQHIFHTDVRL